MLRLAILSLFVVFSLRAANYIDNPNFDDGTKGWPGVSSKTLVPYNEHINLNIIKDQYVVSCVKRTDNMYSFSSIWYEMKNVPNDYPLYFTVEFGCSVIYPVEVQVELVERSESRLSSTSVISKKTVQIIGKDVWHAISSDYPAYRREKNTGLILEIRMTHEKSPYATPDADLCTQVNYAQVGADPKALGGRGARKKNFNKKDEL